MGCEAIPVRRRLAAEGAGTALLLAGVVGSGIMAERLAGGNEAVALLGNTLATGAILVVLILVFGPVSGAHFNPAVTLCFAARREMGPRIALCYAAAQTLGAAAGVMLAHFMFSEPLLAFGGKARTGAGQWAAEAVAAFGLAAAIFGCLKARAEAVPWAVGLFIVAGYWFTSSTCFANPAVTAARALTDSFAGIRPIDAPAFIAAQAAGALAGAAFIAWLHGERARRR